MAFSAHKDPEHVREFESDEEVLEKQASQLAAWIRDSKHFVCFTGAGLSTSAGIPDFRGPQGVWTLRARGETPKSRQSTLSAIPTRGHMALVELEKRGFLKFLISQNCDGLHRRSGFPPGKLAELHGNSNLDRCIKCGKEFLRDFHTRNHSNDVHEHKTIRKCPSCGDWLHDTIINFSENLPEIPLKNGFANSRKADLHLVIGSSLTVSPACRMPQETSASGGKLAIINLQKTPLDSMANLRIFAKVDSFMEKVMKHLGIGIPEWVLQRWIQISLKEGGTFLQISGLEPDGTPASILRQVELLNYGEVVKKEPFKFGVKNNDQKFKIRFHFVGNYNEPSKEFEVSFENEKTEIRLQFELRLGMPDWKVAVVG